MFKLIVDAIKELLRAIFAPLGMLFGGVFQSIAAIFNIQAGEVKKLAMVLVSILVIVGSLSSLFFTMRTPKPVINLQPFVGLGEVTARQTIQVAGNEGEVLVVVRPLGESGSPVYEAQLDAFRSVLGKESNLKIRHVEEVLYDPMEMDEMMMGMIGLSGATYLDLLRAHPEVAVVVSFLGTPVFTEDQLKQLPTRRPKLVAVDVDNPMPGAGFQQDLVQVVITHRYEPPSESQAEPTTPQEWFDRYYMVITPDNMDQLPDWLRGA